VRFLLDTHVWLWSLSEVHRLSASARSLLEDAGNRPVVSIASFWEVAIKSSLGKLALPLPAAEYLPRMREESGVDVLGVELPHVIEVARLEWRHRDPFDRMLVAQARVEQLPVMTADAKVRAYGIETIGC
jgi:PIN domain nuclease of toxin-antitoxin system